MKTIRLLILSLAFGAIVVNLSAQSEPGSIIPGKMMVQLSDMNQLSALSQEFAPFNFKVERILSHRLNIALVSYDEAGILAEDLLSQLRQNSLVRLAQHEHVLQLRELSSDSIPDDPFFGLQWSLQNTGQSGGLAGADIDALNAWGITTGGLTAHGDTIVVAVIDSGCDVFHPDLNLFKNWNEIPGNGIDDDNNGYIDDFHGWNAYNGTGNVPASNHGTHVSGTIGAFGNNGTGVTGVNWNVKVLPIAGSSGNESTVVAAYAYVYDMRALYDETDGEYGAFIVATNSSFGVNFGQPENYPIWGAMYDSLGTLGILSAAATANLNINIDSVGDVPTAFPSPHLISVTNTTHMDVKATSAGYGLETIDLGAPGTSIYSTRNNNTYGYSTGTSMATPHVAGAVALILASADSVFIDFYKENPAAAALQLKQHLLDGTDSLETLLGLTVSGGRLNVFNPMLMLYNPLPQLYADLDSIDVSLYPDEETTAGFIISSTGIDSLSFNIIIKDNPQWLSVEPDTGIMAGGDSITITVDVNTFGLEPEDYQAMIMIEGQGGQGDSVKVKLHVLRLVGIDEHITHKLKVNVMPNPFRGSTTFHIENPDQSSFEIVIIDSQGKNVTMARPYTGIGSNFSWQWHGTDTNGNACSDGMYFYKIITGSHSYSGKLLLQRLAP
ncbi:MAG: S8 family serine peptidase [Bacteroidales bacterium]|nr:S8 family serine peptidase [Bacteroidales bacterium]